MTDKHTKPENEPCLPAGLDEGAVGPEMPSLPVFNVPAALSIEGFVSITLNLPEGMYRDIAVRADRERKNLELVVLEALWAYLQKAHS
jgi:hypothetical protein